MVLGDDKQKELAVALMMVQKELAEVEARVDPVGSLVEEVNYLIFLYISLNVCMLSPLLFLLVKLLMVQVISPKVKSKV